MKEKKLYITFYTSAEAMATEQVCKENNIKIKLVPVPREFSSGCGISVETDPNMKDKLLKLLEDERIEFEDCKEI